MAVRAPRVALLLRDRIESGGVQRGLIYPWWIALSCAVLSTGAAALGVLQRDLLADPRPMLLAPVLVLLPYLLQFSQDRWVPWWVTLGLTGAGAAWLLTDGLAGAYDLVPAVLAVVVAGVTATDGLRIGAVSGGIALVLLVAMLSLEMATAFYGLEVVLGFFVGAMLRWQMRALVAEHAAREEDRERAVLAERQRIAREVHDLVAHSLSVTMLHVTGARRALADDEPDVADAIEALGDAERIGRQAMAEIRRTVGLLAEGEEQRHPLPGAADIPSLIDDARTAGVDIALTCEGDLASLPPTVGLGVYRIVQESVANAVKHAAGRPVTVELVARSASTRLSVRNPLDERRRSDGRGSGLGGMRTRAEQLGGVLTAGPSNGSWLVDLTVPHRGGGTPHRGCVVRRGWR
ncbi:sensor histidine kinase [Nocardioides daejeonensis]|uniref:sensor histidine kinase n=1 Tax=Nocardioides daejeonensis TaxID=1046556 RepID=UPI0013A5967F|nr:histidine kinase [Nocardioides daejeonensis]